MATCQDSITRFTKKCLKVEKKLLVNKYLAKQHNKETSIISNEWYGDNDI